MRRGFCSRTLLAMAMLLVLGTTAAALPTGAVATCLGEGPTQQAGTLTGTAGDDVMLGTSSGETMDGLGGRDLICGGGGDDVIRGGGGNDTLVGGDGADSLYGQGGCDTLKGGSGNDLLLPGLACIDYVDTAEGQGGRDRIVVDAGGRHDVYGGLGKDTLDLRKAPAGMTVEVREHTYRPTANPVVESTLYEVEVVFGSQFGDYLYGSELNDDLRGFGGDDYLFGGDGDDRLIGGDGWDDVDGWNGSDVCEGEHLQLCNP